MHSFFIESISQEEREAFRIVSQAQQLAGGAITPGATVGAIADRIDEFLVQSGFYGKEDVGKPHGHGQGVDIAESPLLVHGDLTVIQPGMRLNVHPRIILPSGATLVSTDCYVATATGSRRLSNLSYEPVVKKKFS